MCRTKSNMLVMITALLFLAVHGYDKVGDLILEDFSFSKCIDSKSFSLDGSNESCDGIGLDNLSRNLLCTDDIIQLNCPLTCGICCYDDSEFKLDTVTNDDKNCFWLFKKGPKQRKHYCSDEAVSEGCPFTCGTCKSRFNELENGAIRKLSKYQGKANVSKKSETSEGGKRQGKAKGGTSDRLSNKQEKSKKKPNNPNPTPASKSQGKADVSKNGKTTKKAKCQGKGGTPNPTPPPVPPPIRLLTPVPTRVLTSRPLEAAPTPPPMQPTTKPIRRGKKKRKKNNKTNNPKPPFTSVPTAAFVFQFAESFTQSAILKYLVPDGHSIRL